MQSAVIEEDDLLPDEVLNLHEERKSGWGSECTECSRVVQEDGQTFYRSVSYPCDVVIGHENTDQAEDLSDLETQDGFFDPHL